MRASYIAKKDWTFAPEHAIILLASRQNRICGHRTSASISAFQAEEVGSIPIARSILFRRWFVKNQRLSVCSDPVFDPHSHSGDPKAALSPKNRERAAFLLYYNVIVLTYSTGSYLPGCRYAPSRCGASGGRRPSGSARCRPARAAGSRRRRRPRPPGRPPTQKSAARPSRCWLHLLPPTAALWAAVR